MGGVFQEQGHLQEALRSYRDSFLIREKLAKADPRNNEAQRDLLCPMRALETYLRHKAISRRPAMVPRWSQDR